MKVRRTLNSLRYILNSSTCFEHGTRRVAALAGCASESSSYPPSSYLVRCGSLMLEPTTERPTPFLVRLARASRTGRTTRRALSILRRDRVNSLDEGELVMNENT